ncbi:MAG: TonB-dependent receptor domain-containing protein [Terriglobia bacterium]
MKPTIRVYLVSLLVLFFLTSVHALGQVTAGVRGTVSDATGAVIPGAKITVINVGTDFSQSTVANASGIYTFTLLPIGTYNLTAEAAGFRSYQRKGIILTTSQILGLNLSLQVGNVRQAVQVSGSVPLVNTQTTEISTLINSRQIRELPLNGRNPIQLATLTNGVNVALVPTVIKGQNSQVMSHLGVNGNQMFMTEYELDGGEFEDPELNGGLNFPNPDAIQEFRFITSNYTAEYGKNPGGVLSVVTKSGTNDLHGDAWEFNRNSAVAARTFFLPTVPFLNQNQFGFTLGGPAIKNKLFLFGTAQWLRIAEGSAVSSAFPPTQAERGGDFSASGKPIVDPETGNPFPGNIIPKDRIDPVAAKFLNLIPLPNFSDGSFRGAFAEPSHNYQWLVKPDYILSDKQRLSGSVFVDRTASTSLLDFGRFNIPLVNTKGSAAESNDVHITNVIVDHTYNITPNVLNYARFSYIKGFITDLAPGRGPTMSQLGANFPVFPLQDVPAILASGRFSASTGNFTDTTWNEYEISDNVNYIRGAHSLKFGGSFHHAAFQTSYTANNMGVFIGTGGVTGNPLADVMLGKTLSFVSNNQSSDVNQKSFAAYIQDDYKVSRNLVLNLGLRYQVADMFQPQPSFKTPSGGLLRGGSSFKEGQQSIVFKNVPTGLLFPPSPGFGNVGDPGIPNTMVFTPLGDWAPRFGLAWDVRGNGKTAIRAGYGVFYDTWHVNTLQGALEGPPFFVNFFQAETPNLVNPVASLANQFPAQLTQNLSFAPFLPLSLEYVDPHLRNADIQQFNLTLQQQLPDGISVQAAYVGNVSRHLMFINNLNPAVYIPGLNASGKPLSTLSNEDSRRVINQPFLPETPFGQLGNAASRANSSYNALQVQVETRASHGLSLLAAYTWSKTIDLTSYFITTTNLIGSEQNPNDINAEKGLADFNRSQTFSASAVYDTPPLSKALHANNWLVKGVADGWEASSILSLSTGFPFSITTGTDNSLTGVNNDRPNLVGNPYLSADRPTGQMLQKYFNTAAFQPNAIGTYGNLGRNTLVGPGSADVDFGLFKNFAVTERAKLQLRFEFFNLFNTANFSNPTASMGAGPTFGRITSAGPGRIIQFGAKFMF